MTGISLVSILTGPCGPVLQHSCCATWWPHVVSILTGPCGPVLPKEGFDIVRAISVSILTGPCGPVLHPLLLRHVFGSLFQSSPALAGRCYRLYPEIINDPKMFQSSPALAGRCYNRWQQRMVISYLSFQSSPALAGRCYCAEFRLSECGFESYNPSSSIPFFAIYSRKPIHPRSNHRANLMLETAPLNVRARHSLCSNHERFRKIHI